MPTIILAIESSCDDTSFSIVKDAKICSMVVSSQKIHEKYGGVVPELASRAHLQHLIPTFMATMQEAKIETDEIDCVAFTQGPGLLGSLLVGTSFAKSFALANNIPLIAVNHMEAHIMAHFIDEPKPTFPFLCLTVSGGHTQLVIVQAPNSFKIVGETLDDAAGEAFDKTGKMLGLSYPAGPLIDKFAQEGTPKYTFTKPQLEGFNFSFSGLKTGIRNFLKKEVNNNPNFIQEELHNICSSVQHTIVEILISNLEAAAKHYNIDKIAIAGGVSMNSLLRKELESLAHKNQWTHYIPAFKYCTDNAGMIAIAAHYKYLNADFTNQLAKPEPRLKM